MPVNKFLYILFIVINLVSSAEGSQNTISVNYPPDGAIMEFDILSVSLTVPQGAVDAIEVVVNNQVLSSVIPDRGVACFSIPIKLGVNNVIITAVKDGVQSDGIPFKVFRRSDLVSEYKDAPSGFRKYYFHMEERSQCSGCHVLEPGEADRKPVNVAAFPSGKVRINMNEIKATSTCYSCHKALTARPFVHGPAAVWSCLSCHDVQASPRYSVRKPDTKVCFVCHIEQKEKWYSRKYFHGPFNTGMCAICHSPHSSDYPFNLLKSTWDLCISCHTDKGSGRHIVAGYLSPGTFFHPTRGRPDPLRKGKELSCASCHDPHSSDAPKLWRLNVGNRFELCRQCHTQ